MVPVSKIVYDTVSTYARKGLNSQSYLTHSDDNTIFTVVTVTSTNTSFVSLLVRILNSVVIVEQDRNDKALVDALLQAGIKRASIVLAYKGEPAPAAA